MSQMYFMQKKKRKPFLVRNRNSYGTMGLINNQKKFFNGSQSQWSKREYDERVISLDVC